MGTELGGYMGKVLQINLSSREISEYPFSDEDREKYLGGKIMAAKILYDELKVGIDAFDQDNIVVVSTGPMTGTNAPSSSRFNISTLSPQTGFLTSSNCGGNFGLMLKKSGYDAIVLRGKCKEKTWIEITEEDVIYHDATELWGQSTTEVQENLNKKAGKIVIGPAGENMVIHAGVFSQDRTAGRGGVGAVMGSKNIKAITAYGKLKALPVEKNRDEYKKYIKKWIKMIKKHPLTGSQLPKYGTAALLKPMHKHHILATKNFKYGTYDDYEKVCGETLAEKHLIKNKGCITCPIQCGRMVEVDGNVVKGPELETLSLLTANIENSNLEQVFKWNYELDELGMDTITTAGIIAFAMELNEKGLWDNGLEFGKIDNISEIIHKIAYKEGIGEELAKGVKWLSEKYGGKEYAIHSKGMELSAYTPRGAVGQGLGYAVSNRGGCHLNAGYIVLFEIFTFNMNPFSKVNKAEMTILSQNLMEACSAGGQCLFSLYPMVPGFVVKNPTSPVAKVLNFILTRHIAAAVVQWLNKIKHMAIKVPMIPHIKGVELVTGMKMDFGRYKTIGERGYNLEKLMNIKLGWKPDDDSLPERLTDVPQEKDNVKSKVPLEALKKKYYKSRRWDKEGIPKKRLLNKLGL
ncbi:aldehyde ferredoxin oxidoreductase [Vallitalea longa]|uniref:Aldehyde ferredoxin oxidoreductase n=1 Tax=Vallitalea longa TaxID=2936439 RepID=A0A9W6DHC2_9FIRM|nr:aldehyde ferredoxin oxidoreductase family protein [Vallitalea longa]GKX31412.1 aldehyde ferredoxin oxidoreductase [Vallitalea longa]